MSIEVHNLHQHYGETRAIDGVCMKLPDSAQVLALIGPSGGGKSTFLRLIGGIETPTSGIVIVDDQELPKEEEGLLDYRKSNGFLFQAFNLFPHLSALDNIILPLTEVHGWSHHKAEERAHEVVKRFYLEKHLEKHPEQLSGGQQQRIALARAVAHEPALLLLDEPTSALDPEMKAGVLDLIKELCDAGQRIVLSTHEMGFARQSADHVVFLAEGEILEEGKAEELFEASREPKVTQFLDRVMKW